MPYKRMKEPNDLNEVEKSLSNADHISLAAAMPSPPSGIVVGPPEQLQTGVIIVVPDSEPGLQDSNMIDKNLLFNDQTIRKGFIRKVYSILLTQLLFTIGVICLFLYHKPTNLFVQHNPELIMVAMIVNIIILISMACCESARRTYPTNFVLLALFTLTISLLVGAVCGATEASAVLLAVGITAVLVLALSIFAVQTKYDFTAWTGVIIMAILCLSIIGVTGIFYRDLLSSTAMACLGAFLASVLLIADTQMIIGGRHKYQITPEEYVFAALTLYMDVMRIFLYVLRLTKK